MCAKIYWNRSVIKCPTELQWKKNPPRLEGFYLHILCIFFSLCQKYFLKCPLSIWTDEPKDWGGHKS